MKWWEFHNTGTASSNSAVKLGVMPGGDFLNAMEIVFMEDDAAAQSRRGLKGNCSYRVRQTVEERDFQFVRGAWRNWTNKATGTADDPFSGAQAWAPPYMRMIDTPGWSGYQGVGPKSKQFNANGVLSDPNATEVWVQQVFQTWVQGQDCFTDAWSDASIKITWHNSFHLIRDDPDASWRAGTGCRIQQGSMRFGTTALL